MRYVIKVMFLDDLADEWYVIRERQVSRNIEHAQVFETTEAAERIVREFYNDPDNVIVEIVGTVIW